MAIGETTVTVVGNVVGEPVHRTTGGTELASFWLRSNERRRDRASGAWVDGRHLSVKVTCWRQLARSVRDSVGRGDPVVVVGRLYTSEFEVEGSPRAVPEIEALAVGPNLQWCTATVRRNARAAGPAGESTSQLPFPALLDQRPAAAVVTQG